MAEQEVKLDIIGTQYSVCKARIGVFKARPEGLPYMPDELAQNIPAMIDLSLAYIELYERTPALVEALENMIKYINYDDEVEPYLTEAQQALDKFREGK